MERTADLLQSGARYVLALGNRDRAVCTRKAWLTKTFLRASQTSIPHLRGAFRLSNVTAAQADGNAVLEDISLTIPAGSAGCCQVANQAERTAFAELLTREVLPTRGDITIAGHDLYSLHQAVICCAHRICAFAPLPV